MPSANEYRNPYRKDIFFVYFEKNWGLVLRFVSWVLGIVSLAPGIVSRVSGTVFCVSGFGSWVMLGVWICLLGGWIYLLGVWICLLGVWICLLGVKRSRRLAPRPCCAHTGPLSARGFQILLGRLR